MFSWGKNLISSQKLVERKYDMGTRIHNEKAETI